MLNIETLFLRKSNTPEDGGGYIADNSADSRGVEELRYYIGSDTAFFCGEFYRCFYVKNTSPETVRNIDVKINGGKTLDTTSAPYYLLDSMPEHERIATDALETWLDYYTAIEKNQTFLEYMYNKFKIQELPFSNEVVENIRQEYNDVELTETSIDNWVNNNIYKTAYTRSSVLGQVNMSVVKSPKRIAPTIDEAGNGVFINLDNQVQVPSFLPTRIIDELKPDEFYSFYVKMSYKFNHKYNYSQDLSFLSFTWINSNGEFIESQPTRIVFKADYSDLSQSYSDIIKLMYDAYPPFFGEYEE